MANSSATGAKASRNVSGPNGRLSAVTSMRRKNFSELRSPCWAASSTDPPWPAMNPVTAATMPIRSGQVMVRT